GLTGSRRAVRIRALLVAGQITLSLVMLVAAALMIQTMARLESHPLGLRADGLSVIEVQIPRNSAPIRPIYDNVIEKGRSMPGVESAAMTNTWPLSAGFQDDFSIEGVPEPKKDEVAPDSGRQSVTPEYFATVGIPVIAGRIFTGHDREDSQPVAILNQTA